MSSRNKLTPIVSKIFCSPSQVAFVVRNRPHAVNGGDFVVTDGSQKVVFRLDGCGILGTKGELILRDGNGELLLIIRCKGGIVQALSVYKIWKGYMVDYEGAEKLIFSMKEPSSWIAMCNATRRVTIEPKRHDKDWDFEIQASFSERACSIIDHRGNPVAQVIRMREIESMASKEIYGVMVQPGFDQAFVFGVIAILDNIYNESTRC